MFTLTQFSSKTPVFVLVYQAVKPVGKCTLSTHIFKYLLIQQNFIFECGGKIMIAKLEVSKFWRLGHSFPPSPE